MYFHMQFSINYFTFQNALVFSFAVLLRKGGLSDWCEVTEEHSVIMNPRNHFDGYLKPEHDISY